MPVLRYFVFVGGILLALLLVFNAVLPKPVSNALVSNADVPPVRIQSDQKWPERVVFDTSQPTVVPDTIAPVRVAETFSALPVIAATPKARVREAFAQLPLSEQVPAAAAPADVRKADAKSQPKRRVARALSRARAPQPPPMLFAQQPHYGFFNNTW